MDQGTQKQAPGILGSPPLTAPGFSPVADIAAGIPNQMNSVADIAAQVTTPTVPFSRQLERSQYEALGDMTEDELDEEVAKIEEWHFRTGLPYQDIVKGDLHNIDVEKDRTIMESISHNVGIFKGLRQVDKEIHRSSKAYGYNLFLGDEKAALTAREDHLLANETNEKLMGEAGRVKKILATTLDIEVQIESGLKDAFKGAAAGTVVPGLGTAGGAFVGYTQNIFFDNFGSSLIAKEESGMHQDTAVVSAMVESAIITVMETVVLGYGLKFVPGADKLLSKLSSKVVERVVSKTLLQIPVNATKAMTAETSNELAQLVVGELINNMAIERSNELTGGDLQTSTARQVYGQGIEMLKTVGPAMFLVGGAGPTASYTLNNLNNSTQNNAAMEEDAELSTREQEMAEVAEPIDTELRDDNGAVVDLDATVPIQEGQTVLNEAGERQPAVPITPVEEAIHSTGYDMSSVVDEKFDKAVVDDTVDAEGMVEEDLATADIEGSDYGEFIAEVRAVLPRKQAKVVEGMIKARARVTNRTKEQFVQDHQLRFKKVEGTEFGSVEFVKDGETIIRAFQNTNLKDVTHEVGHIFRKDMNAQELAQAESAFGVKDGKWTVSQEEDFAEGFSQYMATGKAPTKGLTKMYEKLKSWISNLMTSAKSEGAQISPQMEAIYEQMLKSQMTKDYQHKIAAIQERDQTLYSQRGGKRQEMTEDVVFAARKTLGAAYQDKTPTQSIWMVGDTEYRTDSTLSAEDQFTELSDQIKRKPEELYRSIELEETTAKVVQEVEHVKKTLMDLVKAAKKAHKQGDIQGRKEAEAKYKATVERTKNRAASKKSRGKIIKDIGKSAKKLKPFSVKGKYRGRFPYSHQKKADLLTAAMSLKVEEAQALVVEMDKTGTPDQLTDLGILRRNMVKMRANQGKMDEGQLMDILTEMNAFIKKGQDLKSDKLAKWQAPVEATQERIRESLENISLRKGLDPNMIDAYDRTMGTFQKMFDSIIQFAVLDFHGYMEMLDMGLQERLGKGAAQLFSETLNSEKRSTAGRIKMNTQILIKASEIYGWKNKRGEFDVKKAESEFAREERKGRAEILSYYKLDKEGNPTTQMRNLNLSRAELRNLYMELQNARVKKAWELDGLGDAEIAAIREQLSEEDVNFINYQLEFYREYYESINEIYKERYDTDLFIEDFYSPIIRDLNETTKDGAINDMLAEMGGTPRSEASPNSFINRVNSKHLTMRQSDVGKMNHYVRQMEHFKAFSLQVRDLQSMFRDQELRQEITNVYGRNFIKSIDTLILNIARNGAYSGELTSFDKGVKQVRGNLTRGLVGGKILATFKQLTSAIAYTQHMPVKTFTKGLLDFFSLSEQDKKDVGWENLSDKEQAKQRVFAIKKHANELKKLSVFIQNRGETIDRDISMLTNSSEFNDLFGKKLPPSFNRVVMMFVKAGDVGAIYAGGWVYYKHLMTQENPETGKNYTQEEAINDMEIVSRNTQQSSELGSLTLAQQGNEFMRLLTMFTSSPRQYTQQAYLAWQGKLAGKVSNAQVAKTTVLFFVALPTLFQTMAMGSFPADEDELRANARAIVTAPFQAVPLLNQATNYMISDIVEGHTYGRGMGGLTILSPVESFYKGGKKLAKEITSENVSYDDMLDGISRMSAIVELGGVPGRAMTRVAIGASDIATGKPIQGVKEVVGISPYQARK